MTEKTIQQLSEEIHKSLSHKVLVALGLTNPAAAHDAEHGEDRADNPKAHEGELGEPDGDIDDLTSYPDFDNEKVWEFGYERGEHYHQYPRSTGYSTAGALVSEVTEPDAKTSKPDEKDKVDFDHGEASELEEATKEKAYHSVFTSNDSGRNWVHHQDHDSQSDADDEVRYVKTAHGWKARRFRVNQSQALWNTMSRDEINSWVKSRISGGLREDDTTTLGKAMSIYRERLNEKK